MGSLVSCQAARMTPVALTLGVVLSFLYPKENLNRGLCQGIWSIRMNTMNETGGSEQQGQVVDIWHAENLQQAGHAIQAARHWQPTAAQRCKIHLFCGNRAL